MTPHFDPDPRPSSRQPGSEGPRPAPFDADDPRWSAYLLGELSPAERLQIESVLEEDLTARRDFEELADVADLVRLALELQAQTTAVPAASSKNPLVSPAPMSEETASASEDPSRPRLVSSRLLAAPSRPRKRIDGRISFAAVVATLGLCLTLLVQSQGLSPVSSTTDPVIARSTGLALGTDLLDRTGEVVNSFTVAAEDSVATFRYTPSIALAYRAEPAESRWDRMSVVSDRVSGLNRERFRRSRGATLEDLAATDFSESQATRTPQTPLPAGVVNAPAMPALNALTATAPAQALDRPLANPQPREIRLVSRFQIPATVPVTNIPVQATRQTMVDVEQSLARGEWPAPESIRLEELVNAFEYDDPLPPGDEVVQLRVEAGECFWNERHRLVRIGLRAEPVNLQQRPPSRLVFMVNSTRPETLSQFSDSLAEASQLFTSLDRVTVVDANGQVAVPTMAGDQVEQKLRGLQAEATWSDKEAKLVQEPQVALQNAYIVANRHFIPGANNRVVMLTDGPIAAGAGVEAKLAESVRSNADAGVNFSAIDLNANFGNTALFQLARSGNGSVNTVSTSAEMSGAVVSELAGGSTVVATEAQLEIEFNPVRVEAYRLLGYEHWNQETPDPDLLASQKELHAGDRLCAVIEVRLNPDANSTLALGPLRYRQQNDTTFVAMQNNEVPAVPVDFDKEWLTVRLTYTPSGSSLPATREVPFDGDADTGSQEVRWAASVVDFGQLLKEPDRLTGGAIEGIRQRAQGAAGGDPRGERGKFLSLLGRAEALAKRTPQDRPAPEALPSREARLRATCDGRYRDLLDKIAVPDDHRRYGVFHELGYQSAQTYRSHTDLPAGHWVYVYPHWYIWGASEQQALMAAPPP